MGGERSRIVFQKFLHILFVRKPFLKLPACLMAQLRSPGSSCKGRDDLALEGDEGWMSETRLQVEGMAGTQEETAESVGLELGLAGRRPGHSPNKRWKISSVVILTGTRVSDLEATEASNLAAESNSRTKGKLCVTLRSLLLHPGVMETFSHTQMSFGKG